MRVPFFLSRYKYVIMYITKRVIVAKRTAHVFILEVCMFI